MTNQFYIWIWNILWKQTCDVLSLLRRHVFITDVYTVKITSTFRRFKRNFGNKNNYIYVFLLVSIHYIYKLYLVYMYMKVLILWLTNLSLTSQVMPALNMTSCQLWCHVFTIEVYPVKVPCTLHKFEVYASCTVIKSLAQSKQLIFLMHIVFLWFSFIKIWIQNENRSLAILWKALLLYMAIWIHVKMPPLPKHPHFLPKRPHSLPKRPHFFTKSPQLFFRIKIILPKRPQFFWLKHHV